MKILKLKDILKLYDIQRPALWRWRTKLNFPAPITPAGMRPLWRMCDIQAWEQQNKENYYR